MNRWLAILVLLGGAGCAEPAYVPKPEQAPPLVYCNSAVGHLEKNGPWILGGKCCCTPTQKMFEAYQKEGTVPATTSYEAFVQLFRDKQVNTDLDPKYVGSNNLNPFGPHVLKGGKDMGTPTPGTRNFEEVVSGQFQAADLDKSRAEQYKKALVAREALKKKVEEKEAEREKADAETEKKKVDPPPPKPVPGGRR